MKSFRFVILTLLFISIHFVDSKLGSSLEENEYDAAQRFMNFIESLGNEENYSKMISIFESLGNFTSDIPVVGKLFGLIAGVLQKFQPEKADPVMTKLNSMDQKLNNLENKLVQIDNDLKAQIDFRTQQQNFEEKMSNIQTVLSNFEQYVAAGKQAMNDPQNEEKQLTLRAKTDYFKNQANTFERDLDYVIDDCLGRKVLESTSGNSILDLYVRHVNGHYKYVSTSLARVNMIITEGVIAFYSFKRILDPNDSSEKYQKDIQSLYNKSKQILDSISQKNEAFSNLKTFISEKFVNGQYRLDTDNYNSFCTSIYDVLYSGYPYNDVEFSIRCFNGVTDDGNSFNGLTDADFNVKFNPIRRASLTAFVDVLDYQPRASYVDIWNTFINNPNRSFQENIQNYKNDRKYRGKGMVNGVLCVKGFEVGFKFKLGPNDLYPNTGTNSRVGIYTNGNKGTYCYFTA